MIFGCSKKPLPVLGETRNFVRFAWLPVQLITTDNNTLWIWLQTYKETLTWRLAGNIKLGGMKVPAWCDSIVYLDV
jgi:hypothetical protein